MFYFLLLFLLHYPAHITSSDRSTQHLIYAIQKINFEEAKIAIESGANIHYKDENKFTLLHDLTHMKLISAHKLLGTHSSVKSIESIFIDLININKIEQMLSTRKVDSSIKNSSGLTPDQMIDEWLDEHCPNHSIINENQSLNNENIKNWLKRLRPNDSIINEDQPLKKVKSSNAMQKFNDVK